MQNDSHHEDNTALKAIGFILAIPLLFFALLCSYKIYGVLTTVDSVHTGFAKYVGIPFNIMLYILVFKSLQFTEAKFVPITTAGSDATLHNKLTKTKTHSSNPNLDAHIDYKIQLPDSALSSFIHRVFKILWLVIRLVSSLILTLLLIFTLLNFSIEALPSIFAILLVLAIVNYQPILRLLRINIEDNTTEQDDKCFFKVLRNIKKISIVVLAITIIINLLQGLLDSGW